ncbi:MAG: NBR1-Ig-like domain-containing protein [Anaerolineaceae bacterium]|jgi:hypothetical protein
MIPKTRRKIALLFTLTVIGALLLIACGSKETPTPVAEYVATSVQSTIQAHGTEVALQQLSMRLTEMASPTNTPIPTEIPVPTAVQITQAPMSTVAPAAPVVPPASAAPVATASPVPTVVCNQLTVVSSSTSDGQTMKPGESFTQTWVLKNTGSCSWNGEYDAIYVSGEKFGVTAADISQTVAPGDVLTISAAMTAPDKAGDYKAIWALQDAANNPFGSFSLHIVVK